MSALRPASTEGQQQPARLEWLSILQLILGMLGFLASMLLAGLLLTAGFGAVSGGSVDRVNGTSMLVFGWISLLTAGLSLPSILYSMMRLFGRDRRAPTGRGFRFASLLLLLWPLVLAVGLRLPLNSRFGPLLLPPLAILGIALPIWWLVELAQRKLGERDAQRDWGLWLGSTYITMPLVLVAEVLLFGVLGIFAYLWLSGRPDITSQIENILQQLLLSASGDPQEAVQALRPLLQNPLVIGGMLLLLAVLLPMMEEALKPLAMLVLWSRRPTPAQGFAAGALCGGTFALLESLLSLGGPTFEGWVAVAVGRAGTALLHISCSALVGWGLARAWRGQPGKLAASYLIALFFHGTWNAFSVLTGLGFLANDLGGPTGILLRPIQAAPAVLIALVLILFVFLWRSGSILRREAIL